MLKLCVKHSCRKTIATHKNQNLCQCLQMKLIPSQRLSTVICEPGEKFHVNTIFPAKSQIQAYAISKQSSWEYQVAHSTKIYPRIYLIKIDNQFQMVPSYTSFTFVMLLMKNASRKLMLMEKCKAIWIYMWNWAE